MAPDGESTGVVVNTGAEIQESDSDTLENSHSIGQTTLAPDGESTGVAVNTGAESKEQENHDKDINNLSTDNEMWQLW